MTIRKPSGFTLIELMIVVAIVAILAMIAYPSFAEQMRKSRRAEAISTLQDLQLRLERHRVDNASYGTFATPSGLDTPHYKFTLSGTATGYSVIATPQPGQDKDSCGTLKLASANGVLTRDPTAGNCW